MSPSPDWLEVLPLDGAATEEAQAWVRSGLLDPGEAQAIALAAQIEADWLLTDDAKARLIAKREGIEVHGSLGIVLWGAASGRLGWDAAYAALESLSLSSLWISSSVLAEARAALRRLCSEPDEA